jgi:CRP-like cAMP-binding protein
LYSITDENDDKVNLTHEQIAAVTGMSRVTTTRVMNNLVEKDMLIQEYKHIRILDRQKLREIFEGKEFY